MIDSSNVRAVCLAARGLIERDGFLRGGGGWHGFGGWCIEGALAKVQGFDTTRVTEESLSSRINRSPAGAAIREYLKANCGAFPGQPLHSWNDHVSSKEVLHVLTVVAEQHAPVPVPAYTVTEKKPVSWWSASLTAIGFTTVSEPEPVPEGAPVEEDRVLVGV